MKRYWSIDLTSGYIVYAIIILLVPSHQRKFCVQTHHFYNISCHVFLTSSFYFHSIFHVFFSSSQNTVKLLEHLVWFVVSRITLCMLTAFCFKTLRQAITHHNPFTFYFFNIFRTYFQSYVRLYYEITLKRWDENNAAMEFTALLFCIFGRRKIFCRNGKLQSMSKQYMMCSGKCTSRYVCCVSQVIANVGVINFGVDIVQLCKPIWIENNEKVLLTYLAWQPSCCIINILFHDWI